ncbi:MAG: hypothetical protein JO043_11610 [Candidatus Eremiobacteraeota bacterium]|nr:hypothetical protein [Candidatus Eremiobacteraeota bacterium]
MRRSLVTLFLLPFAMGLACCPTSATVSRVIPRVGSAPAHPLKLRLKRNSPSSTLTHIVVVIQENRSLDNLMNGFCVNGGSVCANTVTVDPVSGTQLVPASLAAPFGLNHSHGAFALEYDYGKMDGFSKEPALCTKGGHKCGSVFSYVPAPETAIYRQMASVDGVLSDETFETAQAPSVPAHFYAIAGQSGGYDSDHWAIESGNAGSCKSQAAVSVQILMTTPFPGQTGNSVPTCKDFQTIFDLVANAGHSWRFYATGDPFWTPTQDIQHLYGSPNWVKPPSQFLTDAANGNLADVSFVTPSSPSTSDHPANVKNPAAGPNWVASIVNAVGETPYWNNTAVVIWWDDWGGWYDHVVPPTSPVNPDPFEYGFRVPLIVASAYANVGTVDHTPRTFVSALRLIEETFNLPSLGTTDQYEPDGLDSMFNFSQTPITYTPLGGSNARPFLHLRHTNHVPAR